MNAGQFAKRRARIEHDAWHRGQRFASKALAALVREAGAIRIVIFGRQTGWRLPGGQIVCLKHRFPSELDAQTALVGIQECPRTRKIPGRAYQCPHCNGWHLTSQN